MQNILNYSSQRFFIVLHNMPAVPKATKEWRAGDLTHRHTQLFPSNAYHITSPIAIPHATTPNNALPLFPPQVTELNLDNCRSTNIEGLTEEFANLTKLSLINVGLTSLKGFPKLPKLKKLELSDNRISNGLAYLSEATPNITNLNLSGNRLKDMESLKPLEKLAHLEVLDTFNNEATSVDNYREKLFAMIPSLKYLDG